MTTQDVYDGFNSPVGQRFVDKLAKANRAAYHMAVGDVHYRKLVSDALRDVVAACRRSDEFGPGFGIGLLINVLDANVPEKPPRV